MEIVARIKKNVLSLIDKNIVCLYIVLFFILQLINFFNYGINLEEFCDYTAYTLILDGKLPYLDFRWPYGLLGPFINVFILKIFGMELMVLRLTAILLGCLGIILAYKISKFLMPKKIAALSGFWAIFCFSTTPHNYNHYYGTLANLAIVIMLFRFINSFKIYNLFLAGLLLNISFLIHPLTFGIEMFISVLVWLVLLAFVMKLDVAHLIKFVSFFLLGTLIISLPVYLFILSKVPFAKVFDLNLAWSHSNYGRSLIKPLVFRFDLSQVISTPDLLYRLRSIRYLLLMNLINPLIFYLLFFIIPLAALILAIYRTKKKEDHKSILKISILAILTFSNIGYFLYTGPGITSRAEYYLQYPVLLFIFMIYWFDKYLVLHNKRILSITSKLLCLCLVMIVLFFYQGYRIANFFIKKWSTVNITPIRGIHLNEDEMKKYIEPSEYIKNNSNKNDKLFVAYFDPTYYILTGLASIFPEEIYTDFIPYFKIMDSSYLAKYNGKPMKKEDLIIKRIKEERPKFIIKEFINKYNYEPPTKELSQYSIGPKAEKYIYDNYSLSRTFPYSRDEIEVRIYKLKK